MKTDILDRDLFDQLTNADGNEMISIYIPTHRRGREVSQDRIRLKNELSAASEQLAARGRKPRERSSRLSLAERLLDDREFWEHQSKGLGVFIDDAGDITTVSLSTEMGSTCAVMPVFLLRPLAGELKLPVVPVLALTRGSVGLYEVSVKGVARVEADLPESFEDVNWFVDREKQRQQHPDRAGTARGRHGHEPDARENEDLRRFLREVADALPTADGGTPLVVLGDDELVGRFEKEAQQPTVSPANSGLSSPISDGQILNLATPIVEDMNRAADEAAVAEAMEQLGLGNASTDVGEALVDAISGRTAKVVFHRGSEPAWGRVDETSLEVTVSEERSFADVDLLDRLVVYTIGKGGSIRPVDSPLDGRPFVAIRRF
jgi:hypothetical protein